MGKCTYRTVLIGSGNVATHLGKALYREGFEVVQVFSRHFPHASTLSEALHAEPVTEVSRLRTDASLYVFSVSDNVLPTLVNQVYVHLQKHPSAKGTGTDALFFHTAGSIGLSVFPMPHRGIIYPLQTFSKHRPLDFREIPLFVESDTDFDAFQEIASAISDHVYSLDFQSRKVLHLAAVFACNFTNHMYHIGAEILARKGLPLEVLLPLIDETSRKVHTMSPSEAQTGPAVRNDQNVMQAHLDLLDDESLRQIYQLISKRIHDQL